MPYTWRHADPRVLFVLSSNHRRGAEVECLAMVDELHARGWTADVVAVHQTSRPESLPVPALGAERLSAPLLARLRRLSTTADVVVGYGSRSLPACALALVGSSTPFVYRSIGDPTMWVRGGLHLQRTRQLYRRATEVVALYDRASYDLIDHFGIRPERVSIVPNARSDRHFRPATAEERAAARARFGLPPDAPVVAVLATLTPSKRVDVAMEAVAGLPGAHLLVAGGGTEADALGALAQRLDPRRLHLVGPVDDPESVLHAADALTLTSDTEGMAGCLIEAGLSGLPAVATDVGGTRSVVVEGVTGRVVPAGDAPAVRAALAQVLERAGELGPRAREFCAQRYATGQVANSWEAVLRRVARGPIRPFAA